MDWYLGLEHIVREQEPLAPYTWLRLGGPAAYFAEPTSIAELTALVKQASGANLPIRILGGGSNLLIAEEGVAGLVIRLPAESFGTIDRSGNSLICAGGAKLSHVVSVAAREGLAGLEELVGIPGTIGGALRSNASSWHSDLGTYAERVTMLTRTGETLQRGKSQMQFSYRGSNLDELILLEAQFDLEPAASTEVTKRMQRNWIVKRASSPPTSLSQGCLFKDAGGMSAAAIIEQAGLKGFRWGDAQISEQNANFVLVGQKATPRHVIELIETVRKNVNDRLGVRLELSLEIWQ